MSAELDHLVWITRDPDRDAAWLAEQLRSAPVFGGRHEGLGTANQLVGLGDVYLELLYPDPESDKSNAMLDQYADLSAGGLGTWAARCSDLPALHERALAAGLTSTGPVPLSRAAPDGRLLEWQLLFVGGHEFGPLMPFFIDWGDFPHPAAGLEPAAVVEDFHLVSPRAEALARLFGQLALEARAEAGDSAALQAQLGDISLPLAQPFGQFSMSGLP